jgi:sugar phosphate isomerase/epimerase
MAGLISRRKMLRTGATSLGVLAGGLTAGPVLAQQTVSPKKLAPGATPIRLAIRMVREGKESPEETVKRIREGGYTAVNTQPSQWNDAELTELSAALKKYDVVVFEVGAYSNIIHPDRARRQEIISAIIQKFEGAEKIGGILVATVSGSWDRRYLINPQPENWSKETWKVLVQSVKQILRDTAGMKTALGMEAQVTTNLDSPKAHKRLIDDVGDPRCAVNLDPTNMVSLDRYFHSTELLRECFDLLGESILGCHAKDTFIEPDIQTLLIREVCPGRGVMDYETFLAGMSRMKWARALFPEHLPNDQYPEAYAYIRKIAEKTGVKIHA